MFFSNDVSKEKAVQNQLVTALASPDSFCYQTQNTKISFAGLTAIQIDFYGVLFIYRVGFTVKQAS